jgi:mannose-6-phosphate isomerase-like protein (cupin superfamily)
MIPDRGAADRLSEHLDVVFSGDIIRSGGLDPTLGDVIERFFAADDAPGPPPGLADQIWKELSERAALPALAPYELASHPERNGRVPIPFRRNAQPERDSSALAYLATAALIVLTLVGGILASRGSLRLPGPDEQAAIIPAIANTPEGRVPADDSADAVLLRETIEQMPSAGGTHQLALYRATLAPGAVEPVGSQTDNGVGNEVFTIESGQVTVEADAPVIVTRAVKSPAAASSLVEPGTAIVLDVGDQLFAPSGVSFRRRNDGPTPATLLGFSIGNVGDLVQTFSSPPGVTYAHGLPFKLLSVFPAVPIDTTVRRLTLAPGAELAVRELPGLQLVYVESGTLDLVYDGAETTGTPGPAFTIQAGSGTDTFGRTPEQAVLANRGDVPLVILTASLVPANAGESTPQEPWSDGWGTGDHVLQ